MYFDHLTLIMFGQLIIYYATTPRQKINNLVDQMKINDICSGLLVTNADMLSL